MSLSNTPNDIEQKGTSSNAPRRLQTSLASSRTGRPSSASSSSAKPRHATVAHSLPPSLGYPSDDSSDGADCVPVPV
ncbi:hypothetical protein V5O48_017409, partial [Marasmius crinis-equi]